MNRESLNRQNQKMTLKPEGISWSIQSDFIFRHHNEPRVLLHVPKEETCSIPPKYMNVTRSTHTDLDVMQAKRVDDYWNVDSSKRVSDDSWRVSDDSWRGFTKFTLLKETSNRIHVIREKTEEH